MSSRIFLFFAGFREKKSGLGDPARDEAAPGLPSEGVSIVTRMLDDESDILFHLDAEGRLVGASGLSRGNKIAKDIRLAEMLIANRSHPDQQAFVDPKFNLKSLLKA